MPVFGKFYLFIYQVERSHQRYCKPGLLVG